jgi:putative glutamine amidotransferase
MSRRAGPVVGVSTGFTHYGDYLGLAFTRPLRRLGALPLIVPYLEDGKVAQNAVEHLDGLVLGIGCDLDPGSYGGDDHPSLTDHSAYRDGCELTLARLALANGIPLLGVCRGMQVINVALGGTLHADHSVLPPPASAHPGGDWARWAEVVSATLANEPVPAHPSHAISVLPGSSLAGVLGEMAGVNSYHHQSLALLGLGVAPVAWAEDGVVEAIEVPTAPALCLGVQWELQESWRDDPTQLAIFGLLVDRARRRMEALGMNPSYP